MTTEEEKKLGKKVVLEIRKEADFVRDLNVQAFVERIGYSLVDQLGSTPFEFKFYVINALDPNAFAIPGGYIFVTTGLILWQRTNRRSQECSLMKSPMSRRGILRKMIEKSKSSQHCHSGRHGRRDACGQRWGRIGSVCGDGAGHSRGSSIEIFPRNRSRMRINTA